MDDDPGLLRLLTIRLRAESYEVEAVESAAAALAGCTRFRPDLVITDLRMDQMDGIGLLKELQSRWPGLKVIILTAHGTIPDAVHATQSGAFGFLTKPVDKQDLLDHVQKALKVSGFAHVDEDWRASIITRNQLMEDKLAQANMVALTMVFTLTPLVGLFTQEGEAAWNLWVPSVAQTTLMDRVLKNAPIGLLDVAPSLLLCIVLTAAALMFVTRQLAKRAAQ